MELNETVELMNSANYKDRFKGEYFQVKIRHDKQKVMCDKWDEGKLNFKPTCPREIYDLQLDSMKKYMDILVIRAKIEDIELIQEVTVYEFCICVYIYDAWPQGCAQSLDWILAYR